MLILNNILEIPQRFWISQFRRPFFKLNQRSWNQCRVFRF